MPRLEIPDVPERVFQQLQSRASREGKSVDAAALDCISQALEGDLSKARDEEMEAVRRHRELLQSQGVFIKDDEELRAAKNWGRE
jgi:plasmid stability protein